MESFRALCDGFAVNTRLNLKLELDSSRESLIFFFEQIRKAFPTMTRFKRRDEGVLLLEDSTDDSARKALRLDIHSLRLNVTSPTDYESVERFGEIVFDYAPAHLSLSELDYDRMDVSYAFDLEYEGNHDELVADTFLMDHPLMSALHGIGHRTIDCQPRLGMAISEDSMTQALIEFKSRTTASEVRTAEYEPLPLTVVLTLRRYWGGHALPGLVETYRSLLGLGQKLATERVIPHVVQPLAAAIASRQ